LDDVSADSAILPSVIKFDACFFYVRNKEDVRLPDVIHVFGG
jgi:hypothetical protein